MLSSQPSPFVKLVKRGLGGTHEPVPMGIIQSKIITRVEMMDCMVGSSHKILGGPVGIKPAGRKLHPEMVHGIGKMAQDDENKK